MDLTHKFLIAMPAMADPNFAGSVVYVCEHTDKGALGLVINRPTELTLENLFDRIELKLEIAPWKDAPVYYGGPVQTERGFVVHAPLGDWEATLKVSDEIGVTASQDVLAAIAAGRGPKRALIALGYAGWGAGQLEREMADNAWLSGPATPEVLFDTPVEKRWAAAAALLGVDLNLLSSDAGHA